MRKTLVVLLIWLGLLYAPLLWLRASVPILHPEASPPVEAALIFGALVREGQISPLHRERLEAGLQLWEAGRARTLVVSNAARAAGFMRDYLLARGVPETAIEIDGAAYSTPDTCVTEAARPSPRKVALVSQYYHLPRIALQCRRLGVEGVYVAAPRNAGPGRTGLLQRWQIRTGRQTREAALIWAELLGVYRGLERRISR